MENECLLNTVSNIIFGNFSAVDDKCMLNFLQNCLIGDYKDFNKNNFLDVLSKELKESDNFVKEVRKMLTVASDYIDSYNIEDFGFTAYVNIEEELTEGDYAWSQVVCISGSSYLLKGIYNKRSGTVTPFADGYELLK